MHTVPKTHPCLHHMCSPRPMHWTPTLLSPYLVGVHLVRSHHLSSHLEAFSAVTHQIRPSPKPPGAQMSSLELRECGWAPQGPMLLGGCVSPSPKLRPQEALPYPVGLDARAHLLFPSPTLLPEEMPAGSPSQTDTWGQALRTGTAPPPPPPGLSPPAPWHLPTLPRLARPCRPVCLLQA